MKSCTRFAAVLGLLVVSLMLSLLSSGCESVPFATSSSATSKPGGGGAWVLVGDNWVYISGDQPYICTDTVCAGAGGSAMYAYQFNTNLGLDRWARFVLIESSGTGSVSLLGGGSQTFGTDLPSYIDVHLNNDKIGHAKACKFTLEDLKQSKPPSGFPSDALWRRLRDLNAAVEKQHDEHHLPSPGSHPHP